VELKALSADSYSDMSAHLHPEKIERFYDRRLETAEMVAVWEHLDACDDCHRLFRDAFQSRRQGVPTTVNLSPAFWFRDEHFDYATMAKYADETLDAEMREVAELHLQTCADCRLELQSLMAFRRATEPDLKLRYGPNQTTRTFGWLSLLWNWPRINWKPAYAYVALILIGLAIAAEVSIFKPARDRKSGRETQISLTPSPLASASPSPALKEKTIAQSLTNEFSPKSNSSPPKLIRRTPYRAHPSHSQTLLALNDGGRKVALDRNGHVTGLDDLPPEMRQSVQNFLLAGEVKLPDFLSEFSSARSTLRGTGDNISFRLLSPVGVVIADDRPTFRWEPLKGATSYRVEISDSPSRDPIRSDSLPTSATEWTPTGALLRDKTYSWVVVATVGGKEVVSPDASLPEARFKVLGDEEAIELNVLKRAGSHLALGVFFAREGMIAEAEKELQMLAERNPELPEIQKVIRSLQSRRAP
jgi:hypothetical protein